MENCAVCGVESKQKCAGCSSVFYCSRDHQIADWKNGHKKNCKCYDVDYNDTLGRFMVAKRDIRPGEVILREKPLIIGPKTLSNVMCLGCHKSLSPTQNSCFYRCTQCTWPLCGKECEKSEYHVDECRVMSAKKMKCSIANNTTKPETIYCVIVPLRFILLKTKNPKLFAKLSNLVSHLDQRIKTKLYDILRINLVSFIINYLQIPDTSEREILNIAGILDTNCFEVLLTSKRVKARGIYFETAMMAHECIPNTKHFVDENFEMKVIATVGIKKGQMILTSYVHSLRTTIERRLTIKQAKCFDCICSRCKDPTEMNTFSSSIRCSACNDGVLTSSDPLENLSEWKCRRCDQKVSGTKIIQVMNDVRSRLDSLNKKSVDECEKFLKDYEKLLPNSSVYAIDVKYALCMLYGNVDGYFCEDLALKQIHRKQELCEELIKELSIIEPGISNSVLNSKFELEVANFFNFTN